MNNITFYNAEKMIYNELQEGFELNVSSFQNDKILTVITKTDYFIGRAYNFDLALDDIISKIITSRAKKDEFEKN